MSEQTKALATTITFSDCLQAAEHLHGSKYYADCQNVNQAVAKILTGRELGIPPVAAMVGIQIIKGKPQLSATTMAGLIKRSGRYTYAVRKLDETGCEVVFRERTTSGVWAEIGVSTFTMQDAKKAGTQNLDKFPRNMLFARALSNGFRWYCPDLFLGPVYVEGELDDTPTTEAHESQLPSLPPPEEKPALSADEMHVKLLRRCHRELSRREKTWQAALMHFGVDIPESWGEPAAGDEGIELAAEMTWVPEPVVLKILDFLAPKGKPAPKA